MERSKEYTVSSSSDPYIFRWAELTNKQFVGKEQKVMAQFQGFYDKIEKELVYSADEQLQAIWDDWDNGKVLNKQNIYKYERAKKLLDGIEREMGALQPQTRKLIQQAEADFARMGISHSETFLSAIEGGYGLSLDFNKLPDKAVRVAVSMARPGEPLSLILARANSEEWRRKRLGELIVEGVALGYSPRKVARQMAEVTRSTARQFEMIARDSMVRSHRMGSLLAYRESGVVLAYKRLAAKDTRTCLACLAMDGATFKVNDMLPLHPVDRCSMIPIVKGGPVPTWESGEEWFSKQTKATQLDMMGPGKFEAWEKGNFKFSQLATQKPNSTWGPSLRVTSLKDLKAGKGGVKLAEVDLRPPEKKPKKNKGGIAEGIPRSGRGKEIRQQIEKGDIFKAGEAQRKPIIGRIERQNKIVDRLQERRSALLKKLSSGEVTGDALERGKVTYKGIVERLDKETKTLFDLKRELKRVQADPRNAILEIVRRGGKPQDIFEWGDGLKRAGKHATPIRGVMEMGREAFFDLVGNKKALKGKKVEFVRAKNDRAYHLEGREIALGKYNSAKTMIHEMGHYLEYHDERVHRLAVEFLITESGGGKWDKLSKITGNRGYRSDEIAFLVEDENQSPYTWKIYLKYYWNSSKGKWEQHKVEEIKNNPAEVLRSTEIVSMGLEQMWDDPAKLARQSPKLFDLIVDIIDLD